MSTIQIFDPALCCSSGVCGQDVDAHLVQAAANIDWGKGQGAQIERFNLAQQRWSSLRAKQRADSRSVSGRTHCRSPCSMARW